MGEWDEKELTNEDINKMLVMFDRVNELIKIKYESLQNLAIGKLQKNEVIGDYSYEPKYGDRTWKDGVSVESIKAMTGIDISKNDIMSPNQAERAGLSKKYTAALTFKKNTGVKLVKSSNTLKKAQEVFKR
jgi:hypothetical protein